VRHARGPASWAVASHDKLCRIVTARLLHYACLALFPPHHPGPSITTLPPLVLWTPLLPCGHPGCITCLVYLCLTRFSQCVILATAEARVYHCSFWATIIVAAPQVLVNDEVPIPGGCITEQVVFCHWCSTSLVDTDGALLLPPLLSLFPPPFPHRFSPSRPQQAVSHGRCSPC
jgi:hypothetical protein